MHKQPDTRKHKHTPAHTQTQAREHVRTTIQTLANTDTRTCMLPCTCTKTLTHMHPESLARAPHECLSGWISPCPCASAYVPVYMPACQPVGCQPLCPVLFPCVCMCLPQMSLSFPVAVSLHVPVLSVRLPACQPACLCSVCPCLSLYNICSKIWPCCFPLHVPVPLLIDVCVLS